MGGKGRRQHRKGGNHELICWMKYIEGAENRKAREEQERDSVEAESEIIHCRITTISCSVPLQD